jgi:hypothetical protein
MSTDQASLFSQFLDLLEGAIGTSSTTVTATSGDDATTSTTTDESDSDATGSSDLAAQIAAQMQNAGVQFATAAGVASPADLGARAPGPSQTSAPNTGIDGHGGSAVGAAGPGASLGIAGAGTGAGTAAPTAAETASEEATANAEFAASLAAKTARRTDDAEARGTDGGTSTTNTNTDTDPLGLTSLVGRAARTARSDGTPLTYRAPQTAEAAKAAATADQVKANAGKVDAAKENAAAEATAADRALLAQQAQKGAPKEAETTDLDGGASAPVEARPPAHSNTNPAAADLAQTRQTATADPTAQTTRSVPVVHAVTLAALAETVAAQANRGRSRFEMRLEPADLGRIDVSLTVGSTGDVKAHLVVERPETLDMMMRDQRNLERSLANAGLDVGNSGLQFSLRGEGDRRGSEQPQPTIVTATEEDAPPVVPEVAAVAYRSLRTGALDLRV